jgi:BirA family transcriptional regulator, biotin operon repressor / biotin---[acetyl-CoA-carboxylase] ligase
MEPWPAGVGREVHATLDSTNAEALRRAATTPGPLWILALEQSAARGRRGRAWTTGRGNFAATLLMTPSGGPREAALRSFVAALALHEVLTGLVGAAGRFSLKWPNDVLVDGGKLAGILLETAGPPLRLAVGFGVNLVEAPVDLPPEAERAASLADATGHRLAPEALLDALAPAFARWEARLVAEGSRRCARRGSRGRRGSARRWWRGCRGLATRGASRRSTRAAPWCWRLTAAGWCCRRPRCISAMGRAMLLAIDVGNTNAVFALHDGERSSASGAAAPSASARRTSISSG